MEKRKKVLIIVGIVLGIALVAVIAVWPVIFDILAAAVVFIAVVFAALFGRGGGADVPPARPRSRMSCCRSCGYIGVGRSYCIKCGSTWLEEIDW